jgi:hypothetical protein
MAPFPIADFSRALPTPRSRSNMLTMKQQTWVRLALLALTFLATPVVAQQSVHLGEAVSTTAAEQRLARIRTALDADESHVKLWWFGWAGVIGGSAIVQTGGSVIIQDPGWRADFQTGAVTSWLGMTGLALVPVKPLHRWDSLLDAPVEMQLRMAEAELRDRAKREKQVGGWIDHTLNVLVGLSAGAYLWFHENRHTTAISTSILDIAVGELQLWTVPHTAVHAVEALDAEKVP